LREQGDRVHVDYFIEQKKQEQCLPIVAYPNVGKILRLTMNVLR